MKRRIALVLLILAVMAAAAYWNFRMRDTNGDGLRVSGNIEVTDVECSFKIPGLIEVRLVSEGEAVEQGAEIARLDKADLTQEVAMRQAEANAVAAKLAELRAGSRTEEIAQAKAAVDRAQAMVDELEKGARPQEIATAQAAVNRARAEKERLETDQKRMADLVAKHVVAQQQYDATVAAYRASVATLEQAQEQLDLVKEGPRKEDIEQARAALDEVKSRYDLVVEGPRAETLEQAEAELQRAKEALTLAETRLGYTTITAPLSGIVLSEHVESGEYVTPGAPVVTVGNLDKVWLRAYIKETDLGRVKLGTPVKQINAKYFPAKKHAE